MLKSVLFVIANAFLINTVKCQMADTSISYYKKDLHGSHKVSTLDNADYFRVILPPDSADNRFNIKEFYKNGKIKFIGKSDPRLNNVFKPGEILLSGDCISFFPNGKRQSIAHYSGGNKEGDEYLYYPNGGIYCYRKYMISNGIFIDAPINWECYDSKGKMICKEGNGQWIIYDDEIKNILIMGKVKNGYKDGEWNGRTPDTDSIKYVYKYNRGILVSGIGYDKKGVAHPFTKEAEMANYRGKEITFIEVFKSHLILPKGVNGKKMLADTIHISFTVEKDGHLTEFKTLEEVNPELSAALKSAISKCHDWTPSTYFGVPLRTNVILPLKLLETYSGNLYIKQAFIIERIIGF